MTLYEDITESFTNDEGVLYIGIDTDTNELIDVLEAIKRNESNHYAIEYNERDPYFIRYRKL